MILKQTAARRHHKKENLRLKLEDMSASTFQDMHQVIANGLAGYSRMKKRAAYISQSEVVEAWLTSAKAEILIVNSHERPEPITAASLFCALLVQSIKQIKPAVCLYWFCGLHFQETSSDMIRTLCAQLLENSDDQLDLPQKLLNRGLEEFWNVLYVLEILIEQQLHCSPVFFVIDGFSLYEDGSDLALLLHRLCEIETRSQDWDNCLKVIMTSPTDSSGNEAAQFASEIFDLPLSLGHIGNSTLDEDEVTEGMMLSVTRDLSEARPSLCDDKDEQDSFITYRGWEG